MRLTLIMTTEEYARLESLSRALAEGLGDEIASKMTPESLAALALTNGLKEIGADWYQAEASKVTTGG